MSVYSGFATRQQESFYNKLLEKTFELMSFKLISFHKLSEENGMAAATEQDKWFL
jgi:hypothetical protein